MSDTYTYEVEEREKISKKERKAKKREKNLENKDSADATETKEQIKKVAKKGGNKFFKIRNNKVLQISAPTEVAKLRPYLAFYVNMTELQKASNNNNN